MLGELGGEDVQAAVHQQVRQVGVANRQAFLGHSRTHGLVDGLGVTPVQQGPQLDLEPPAGLRCVAQRLVHGAAGGLAVSRGHEQLGEQVTGVPDPVRAVDAGRSQGPLDPLRRFVHVTQPGRCQPGMPLTGRMIRVTFQRREGELTAQVPVARAPGLLG